MSKIDSEIARAVKILTGDPESPVARFVNAPSPDTDLSYLQMWFDYLKYMNEGRDHFSELINDGWLSFSKITMNFEIRHGVWTNLKALMEGTLQNHLKGLTFVPRLEQYVETYGEHERENVRKLILIYLMAMQEKFFRDNLVELGEKAGLQKQFIYSLNDKYKLFSDKVIEVDATGYSSDNKSFLQKDIMLNTAIYKIFANMEVADTESILLFDEADALFASRTSIATANDRFLNTETDVLLGLIERFNSIAILTTNYIENIDKAFFRRMQYIVEFREPDRELRLRLLKTLCPPRLPLSPEVDFEKLASEFKFNGGDVKNVLIRAATKRAVRIDQNRSVNMEDLIEASRDIENKNATDPKKSSLKHKMMMMRNPKIFLN